MSLIGVKLKLSRNYTIQELYDLIKYVSFEAGQSQFVQHGHSWLIAFPELCTNN